MIDYNEWKVAESSNKMYELYVEGPGIKQQCEKAIKCIKDIVPNPKSFLVVKFRGTNEDVKDVKRELNKINFKVVEVEIEDHH